MSWKVYMLCPEPVLHCIQDLLLYSSWGTRLVPADIREIQVTTKEDWPLYGMVRDGKGWFGMI